MPVVLARFFNTTPQFWLNLQAAHDLAASRPARRIQLRMGRLASTLGMEVGRERALAALASLGFEVRPLGEESAEAPGIEAVVPSHHAAYFSSFVSTRMAVWVGALSQLKL